MLFFQSFHYHSSSRVSLFFQSVAPAFHLSSDISLLLVCSVALVCYLYPGSPAPSIEQAIKQATPTTPRKTTPGGPFPTSPYPASDVDLTKMSVEDSIGIHVERLNVEVVDGVACYVAGSQYSVPRLKEHFEKDLCWPVAVSNKRGSYALTVCPCKGKPGHEKDGAMHRIDSAKKGAFITNSRHFRLKLGEAGYRKSSHQGNGQP